MSHDNKTQNETTEAAATHTGRAKGIVIAVPKRPSLDGLLTEGSPMVVEADSELGVQILNAVFGEGHSFLDIIGHTAGNFPSIPQELLEHLTTRATHKPSSRNSPVQSVLDQLHRVNMENFFDAPMRKHPLEDQLQRIFGGSTGFASCAGCKAEEPNTASTSLEIAGMVMEGSELLTIGSKFIHADATEEEKELLKERVKTARKNLKEVLKALDQ